MAKIPQHKSFSVPEDIAAAIAAIRGEPLISTAVEAETAFPVSQMIVHGQHAQKEKTLKIGDKAPDFMSYAGISPDTGRAMYVAEDDVRPRSFGEALKFAERESKLMKCHHRLPTEKELKQIFNYKAELGLGATVKPETLYWSMTTSCGIFVKCVDLNDGSVHRQTMGKTHSVLLVRS